MDNRAGEMMVFVRGVEAGSFSEAARAMMMTPSTVSKLIARLEARIGGAAHRAVEAARAHH